jgi:heme exporter protein B
VIWVCALLCAFLSLRVAVRRRLRRRHAGANDVVAAPDVAWVSGKIAAHWMVSGLPLTLLSPLLGLQYGLRPTRSASRRALLLGTPVLSLLGACLRRAVAGRPRGRHAAGPPRPAALRSGADLRRGRRGRSGDRPGAGPHLSLLGAMLLAAAVAVPFAVAAAIRIALD